MRVGIRIQRKRTVEDKTEDDRTDSQTQHERRVTCGSICDTLGWMPSTLTKDRLGIREEHWLLSS